MVVSCVNDSTSVFMTADYLVFGGDIVRTEYMIDGGPVYRAYWNVCAGDLCTGLWKGAGIPFVRSFSRGRAENELYTTLRRADPRDISGPRRARSASGRWSAMRPDAER